MSEGGRLKDQKENAARRQARYRTRQILGIRLVQAEVDLELVEELITAGHLSAPVSENAQSVAEALVAAARRGCSRSGLSASRNQDP